MKSTLTKDQVEKLPPEQQEAVARLVTQQLESRQQLRERARCYRGMNVVGGLLLLLGLAFALAILQLLSFAIIAVAALVAFHAAGINRRLDALMEMTDRKRVAEMEKSGHNIPA